MLQSNNVFMHSAIPAAGSAEVEGSERSKPVENGKGDR